MKHPPWKVLVTVTAITSFGIAAMAFEQWILAGAAVGALVSYLGRLNGGG